MTRSAPETPIGLSHAFDLAAGIGGPVFDDPPGPHHWLNNRLFVAACIFALEAVTIRVFPVDEGLSIFERASGNA